MDMQAVLKAGGVGAVILIVLNVIGTLFSIILPCLGCVTFTLSLVTYVAVGILAVYWMILPRDSGSGATNGAVAAGLAAVVAGLVNLVITALYTAVAGASQLSQIPPEQLQALTEAGIDPTVLAGPVAVVGFAAVCCGLWFFIAAGAGAAGGALWGSRNPS